MTRPCRHTSMTCTSLPGVTKFKCNQCGDAVPLGEAKDTADTSIDLKLAAHISEVCQLWEPKDQDELIDRYVDGFSSQPVTHLDDE
jgi:hypothetical protein